MTELELCKKWLEDPLINPETGRSIEKGGPKYTDFKLRCKTLGLKIKPTGKMTCKKCEMWYKKPDVNPETGRKIKVGGKKYKMIEKQCKKLKPSVILGEYPFPKDGMVDCVVKTGTCYILRKYKGGYIYSLRNLETGTDTKKSVSVYFKDTWDYRNNHYRPIYNTKEPSRPFFYVKHGKTKSTVDRFLGF